MDLAHPYLSTQLIAYIGNKRRLLPRIHQALLEVCGETVHGLTFLDLFAGSGAVSRLARLMGYRVLCNDWEVFARTINTAHVATDSGSADSLFADVGGLVAVLDRLQEGGDPLRPYVSRYYGPASDDPAQADYRRERLFYTRANALAIDRIRERIDLWYPEDGSTRRATQRALLIAPLLYEAATHTNTSGVFKACHKGFGGHRRDALKRILEPIRLQRPVLVDGEAEAVVHCMDANRLAGEVEADVAYLDPPYATHQYGSNYHLLTSIALWDCPPEPLDLDDNGRLVNKAGIRPDWIKTRSTYCSRATAPGALRHLVQTIRARHILLSYSSQGLIPLEEILDICQARGKVSVHTDLYAVYRGGRQSNLRRKTNVEALLVVDTRRPATTSHRRAAARSLARRQAALLFRRRFAYPRLTARFGSPDPSGAFDIHTGSRTLHVRGQVDGMLTTPPDLDTLSLPELRRLIAELEACVCRDAVEELEELVALARDRSAVGLERHLVSGLRRLAHRGNRARFETWLERLRALAADTDGRYQRLLGPLDALEKLAEKRVRG